MENKKDKVELFSHNIRKNVVQKDFNSPGISIKYPTINQIQKTGEKPIEDELDIE